MSTGWITTVGPWHWVLVAIVLIILEAFSPTAFFLWLATAAGTVGLVLAALPKLGWQLQLVLFGVFSILSLILGRRYLRRHPIATDTPTLNKRGHQYIGRIFTLDQPIVNGTGKLRVDDTIWKISGPDRPATTGPCCWPRTATRYATAPPSPWRATGRTDPRSWPVSTAREAGVGWV